MKKITIVLSIMATLLGCSAYTSVDRQVPESVHYDEYRSDAKGYLFIIGGGMIPDYMWREFMGLAGTGPKNVLIIPFASNTPGAPGSSERQQQERLLELGAASVEMLLCEKEELDNPENLDKLANANLVFFSGGYQSALAAYLNGSEFLERLHKFYKGGGVIGGTSAGAAVMSKVMIGGGRKPVAHERENYVTLQKDHVITLDGFGFMENVVIHQHFLYRKRNNTLLSVLLDNPRARGIGIDESTAIVVNTNRTFVVVGESKVLVYEPDNDFSDGKNPPVFIVRILSAGNTYRL